jgi:hypothetical protein
MMTFISKCSANLFAVCLACLWGVILTGCARTAVVGLYPDNPPVTKKGVLLRTAFVEVDTLNPTFRWHPLAIRLYPPEDKDSAQIENITYEIRIWRTVSSDDGKLVYQRKQLTTTEHRLEHALDYGTRYYWSVRAHFDVDGKPRTTEWTLAGYLLRSDSVPNDSCLRFKTPDKPGVTSKVRKEIDMQPTSLKKRRMP